MALGIGKRSSNRWNCKGPTFSYKNSKTTTRIITYRMRPFCPSFLHKTKPIQITNLSSKKKKNPSTKYPISKRSTRALKLLQPKQQQLS